MREGIGSALGGCVATFKKKQESDGSGQPGAVSCSHPEQLVDELDRHCRSRVDDLRYADEGDARAPGPVVPEEAGDSRRGADAQRRCASARVPHAEREADIRVDAAQDAPVPSHRGRGAAGYRHPPRQITGSERALANARIHGRDVEVDTSKSGRQTVLFPADRNGGWSRCT